MAKSTAVIPAEFDPYIRDAIASGKYRSEQEVLNAALRIWREREEKLDSLRQELQTGIDQLDSGEWVDGEEVVRRLQEKAALLKEPEP